LSHTASIAGDDKLYDAIFRQSGVIRALDFYELFDYAKGFSMQPLPKGNRVAILTASGSLGILASDELEKQGLVLAPLSENTVKKMKRNAPDWVSLKNPVDIGPAQIEIFNDCLKALLQEENVDALLWIQIIPERVIKMLGIEKLPLPGRLVRKFGTPSGKPVIVNTFSSPWMKKMLHQVLDKYNIPITISIQNAVKMLAKMLQYRKHKSKFT